MSAKYDSLVPFVIRSKKIQQWKLFSKDISNLSSILGKSELTARFGSKTHVEGSVLWETQCPRRTTTAADFLAWAAGESSSKSELDASFPSGAWWGYVDYTHLLFHEAAAEGLDWSTFGLPSMATDSTLWLGTQGAYTPCHYDTYGFNVHAQLSGAKRWVLFPPTDSRRLRPTRLPFEESSVFADVDVLRSHRDWTSLSKAPTSSVPSELAETAPRMAVLEAGDVLFVPPYWWHSVQCVSSAPSLSVNTWVPVCADAEMRRCEAVRRAAVALLDDGGLLPEAAGLLPSEPQLDFVVALADLRRLTAEDAEEPKRSRGEEATDAALDDFLRTHGPQGIQVPRIPIPQLRAAMRKGPLTMKQEERKCDRPGMDRKEFMRRLLNSIDCSAFLNDYAF